LTHTVVPVTTVTQTSSKLRQVASKLRS